MFRILVVDNEPYVVDWISMLIESKIEAEVDICRAYTAAEALDWLIRSRIDIVISDICMPKMDGLELAEQVKKRWPFAKVILITAHAQFDYAVTAIRNNVTSYILKTQGDDVIINEVERVMALVDQELNQVVLQQNEIDVQVSLPELRSCFFRDLLEKGEEDTGRMRKQLEALKVSMNVNTMVRIVLCSVREWETADNLVMRQQSVIKMIECMNSYLGDCGRIYPVDMGGTRMVWLLHSNQNLKEEQETMLIHGRLELLQDVYLANEGKHISYAIHSQAFCIRNIRNAYRSLELLMNRMSQEEESFVILGNEEVGNQNIDTEVVSRRMKLLLQEEKYDKFLMALTYYQKLVKEKRIEIKDCYNVYYSLALLLNSFMKEREIVKSNQIIHMEATLFFPPLEEQWEKKFEDLSILASLVLSIESEMKARLTRNTVDAVKKYVSEHISEDISLTRLSEVTGYNTCYLSRTFKAQTGETITAYVSRKKMERINMLMQEPNLSIGDVAEQSGFLSRTYFNRFVRKHTGMSPKDYKLSLKVKGE